MARDGSPTKTSARQRQIRQRSPLTLAVLCGGTCLVVLVSLAGRWADNPQPLFAAWVVFALSVVWSLFVRPAVLLGDDGVTIRNIVRDIHIPWDQVTDVESRWNLKVYVGDMGYTAWAISSQVQRPRGVTGMAGSLLSGKSDEDAKVKQHSAAPKITAPSVARAIEEAKEAYAAAVAQGALPAAPAGRVEVRWVPLVIGILILPAMAIAVLSLI